MKYIIPNVSAFKKDFNRMLAGILESETCGLAYEAPSRVTITNTFVPSSTNNRTQVSIKAETLNHGWRNCDKPILPPTFETMFRNNPDYVVELYCHLRGIPVELFKTIK